MATLVVNSLVASMDVVLYQKLFVALMVYIVVPMVTVAVLDLALKVVRRSLHQNTALLSVKFHEA